MSNLSYTKMQLKRIITLTVIVFFAINSHAQFSDVDIEPFQKEVGISMITNNGADTTYLSPIKYKQLKGSGGLAAALTYGIAKIKVKVTYVGNHSSNKVKVGDKFLFKFGNVPINAISSYYMFGSSYSIRNFSVSKFKVKKKERELVSAETSIWSGSKFGTDESTDIAFETKKVAPGMYEATIIQAIPGEYCFIFSDNGVGAYNYTFDFCVE